VPAFIRRRGLADRLTDDYRFGQEVSDLRGNENHPVFGRVAFGAPLGTREAACTERHAKAEDDSCLTAPDSRYRGPENQFYRVEVHHGGKPARVLQRRRQH
jgi:hypothetical protein